MDRTYEILTSVQSSYYMLNQLAITTASLAPPPPFFDCKHPADFKRTALSGRKAAGAILAVLMSTTGDNLLGEIT